MQDREPTSHKVINTLARKMESVAEQTDARLDKIDGKIEKLTQDSYANETEHMKILMRIEFQQTEVTKSVLELKTRLDNTEKSVEAVKTFQNKLVGIVAAVGAVVPFAVVLFQHYVK